MLEWMESEEPLGVKKVHKQIFIDRSLSGLGRVQKHLEPSKEQFYARKISTGLKVMILLGTLIMTYWIKRWEPLIVFGVLEWGVIWTYPKSKWRLLIGASLLLPLFSAIIVLPAILLGNPYSALLPLKVMISITMANLFATSTEWAKFMDLLKKLRVPDVFLLTFDLTFKYLFILTERATDMFYWLKKRNVGSKISLGMVGHLIGNLFVNAYEASEETFHAMACRGYTLDYYGKVKVDTDD